MSTYVGKEDTAITLDIECFVTSNDQYLPLIGNGNLDFDTTNFRWDRELLQSRDSDALHYNTFIGGHSDSLLDGTVDSQWQSGYINGITYDGIELLTDSDRIIWSPIVRTGNYSVFTDQMYLYSNYSVYQRVIDGNVVILESDCVFTTLSVAIYHRDEKLTKRPYRIFKEVEEFSTDEPLRVYEYRVENPLLIVSENYFINVGQSDHTMTADLIRGICENNGPGSGSGRLIYSKYFPLLSDETTAVYVIASDDSVEELSVQETLDFSGPTDAHCLIDKDLGIITVGGYQAPSLVLSEDIDSSATTIPFLPDERKSDSYSIQGVITIGTEKIAYYNRSSNAFYECVRGYDGTTADSHSVYSVIEDIQHGKAYSSDNIFYLKYIAVPAVRYEITNEEKRVDPKTNIKPIRHAITNKIIQISSVEKNVASVVLETSSPLLGGSIYGPVYYGTDFSQLCATVYDSYGNPVEDIETFITIEEEWIGYLNGGSRTYTAFTNAEGQICCLYHAPYNWDDISLKVTSMYHDGLDTIIEITGRPPGILPENVTLFQVLKHDPVVGTVGKKVNCVVGSGAVTTTLGTGTIPYSSFDVEISVDDAVSAFEDGYVDVIVNSVKYRRTILDIIPQYNTDGEPTSIKIVILDPIAGIDDPAALSYAWLFENGAMEWNGLIQNGVNVLMYEWNTEVPHPITGDLGAYFPVRPTEVSNNQLIFENRLLPLADAYDVDNNLGGYVVIIPNLVKLKAYAKDPVSGRLISSNSIRLRLDLPAYLSGIDNSNTALPIPYGFTFITEEFNVGTGIGGSNFITINPRASGISSYNLFITPTSRGH